MAGHEIEKHTIAYIRCRCGWQWRNDRLRGKTDEDLKIESGKEFEKHKKSATAANN